MNLKTKRTAIYLFLVFLLHLLWFITPSKAAENIRMGVLDLEAKGDVRPSTAEVISEQLRIEFAKDPNLKIIGIDRLRGILKEMGYEKSPCVDQQCVLRAGQYAQAEKMTSGFLGNLGKKYILSLKVLDVESESFIFSDQEEGILKLEDLNQLVPPLVSRIIQKLQVEVKKPPEFKESNSIRIVPLPEGLNIKGARVILDARDTTILDLPGVVEDLECRRHFLKIEAPEYVGVTEFELSPSPSPYQVRLKMLSLGTQKTRQEKKKVWLGFRGGNAFGFGERFGSETFQWYDEEGFPKGNLEKKDRLKYYFGAVLRVRFSPEVNFKAIFGYQKGETGINKPGSSYGSQDKKGYHWRYLEANIIRFISTGAKFNPYFEGGGGIFTFISDDEDQEMIRLGLNAGFGVERYLETNLSLDLGVKLYAILTRGANVTFFQIYSGLNFGI